MSGDGRELALVISIDEKQRLIKAREEGAHGREFEFSFDVEGINGQHPRDLKEVFRPKGLIGGTEFWVIREFATVIRVSPKIFP